MYLGDMKTKYWIDKTNKIHDYWYTNGEWLATEIIKVVDYYQSIEIKLTNRQLYYQLVGKDLIPNFQEIYKRICVFLTDMRYEGLIDWDALEDKARVPKKPNDWNSISDIVQAACRQYRLPRWQDQEYYVEMYCEKEAGINVLETISRKYHIYFGFNKGYSSASAMYDLAKRLEDQISDGKYAVILYFGDHDPSGLDMIRDITDRITEFMVSDFSDCFKVHPVSLTKEQIKEFQPPPNPAKLTDPRSKWYIKEHGKVSWELDAIDALELRKMAEESVLEYLDLDKYNAWIDREQREVKALIDFGNTL